MIKEIYNHVNNYMREWFPKLPDYAAFSHRINKLPAAFISLIEKLQLLIPESFSQDLHCGIDPKSIIMAQKAVNKTRTSSGLLVHVFTRLGLHCTCLFRK